MKQILGLCFERCVWGYRNVFEQNQSEAYLGEGKLPKRLEP